MIVGLPRNPIPRYGAAVLAVALSLFMTVRIDILAELPLRFLFFAAVIAALCGVFIRTLTTAISFRIFPLYSRRPPLTGTVFCLAFNTCWL
jgi:hypothetical protein